MNFSFELSWALLTGNINQDAMMGMSALAATIFGWLAMIRILLLLVLGVFLIIARWRLFKKAGLPGWGIFIPFYNRYLMFKMWGRSGRNFLWILIPPVFVILMIINYFKIAKNFWKHWTFGLGIRFVKIVFIPILAFDDSKYLGKKPIVKTISKPITKTITKAPAKPTAKVIAKAPIKAPAKKVIAKKATITKAPAKKPSTGRTAVKKAPTKKPVKK